MAVLLLVVAAQIIPELILAIPQLAGPAVKNNHAYILTVYVLAPLGYLFLFYYGFVWLKKHLYHNDFVQISFPIKLKLRYFAYALLLIIFLVCGSFLAGIKVVTPPLNHWEFMQNLVSEGIMFFVPPFVEEMAFRGIIINRVAERYNLISGVFVSSILFGMVHLLNGALDLASAVQLIISGMLMGILLSLTYVYENSIWADYIIHAIYNLFFTVVPIKASVTHDWPFQLIFTSHKQLITGGQYGSDCSLAFNLSYLLMIFLFLWLLRKKKLH